MNALTRARMLWVWLVVLAACAQAAPVKQAQKNSAAALPEASPAYTAAKAQEYANEVRPLVERITERKIAKMPEVRLVTRQEFIDAMTNERARKETAAYAAPWAGYAFGAYDPARKTIYLLAGNFKPRLEAAGVPARYHETLLKMIIAHELTHALQHQETRLSPPEDRKPNADATRAVIEGHAKFVMDEVAKSLRMKDAIRQFEKTIGVGLVLPGKTPQDARKQEMTAFVDGERFIRWNYQRGGSERVWRIVKSPPVSISLPKITPEVKQ